MLTNRYPFMASEIFNCEMNKVNDMFFMSRAEEHIKSKESSAAKQKESSDKKNKNNNNGDEEEEI
jgi:hypothetical protein